MNSSTWTYTPSQEIRLYRQAASVNNLIFEKKRSPELISQALQAIIGGDDITVTPRVAMTPAGKVFHVTGNAQSAAEAINATGCPVRWGMANKPSEIPLVIQPPVDCRVRAVPLGRFTKSGEIFGLFPKIVDPMTLFAFGAKFPKEQCEEAHFTSWLDAQGQLWFAIIHVCNKERYVRVNSNLDAGWHKDCRVLVYE